MFGVQDQNINCNEKYIDDMYRFTLSWGFYYITS
jgi:hypothetical protein